MSVLSDEQLVVTCYEAIRAAGSTPAENENDMLRLIAEQDPVALAVAAGLRAVADAAIAADRAARAEPVVPEGWKLEIVDDERGVGVRVTRPDGCRHCFWRDGWKGEKNASEQAAYDLCRAMLARNKE